jgi:hypothetical protein
MSDANRLLSRSNEQRQAEYDFLMDRFVATTNSDHTRVGQSSDYMVALAFEMPFHLHWSPRKPHDDGDLSRCERTFQDLPAHLRPRVVDLLVEWREQVAARKVCRQVGHLERQIDTSDGDHIGTRTVCDRCGDVLSLWWQPAPKTTV